ncbi:hypothetical protein PINS_up021018 [Pythium insidiosum]|nr:hypothetical protein PINS_up021018 [Pythium insidiosum]
MRRMLLRLIDAVPTLFDEMVTAFPDAAEIEIPRAYITYNRSSDIFPSEGPPVYWRHSALGVGLVKLASKIAPLPSEVDAWRRSLVCYDTLELRFLNVSTRCWAEPDSVVERRERTRAEGLRLLQFSMWSLGVRAQPHRGGRVAHIPAARLAALGLGMIPFEGVVIMAFSAVPLMLSYHLPSDARFMEQPLNGGGRRDLKSAALAEAIVLLSLTWFVRLGIALGDSVVRLRRFNWWFNALTSKLRYVTIAVIAALRQAFRVDGVDYDMALSKLIVSCVASTLLGFLSIAASLCFDRETESEHENLRDDPLSQLMAQHGLVRNLHGTIAQFGGTWTQTGLVMEGWHALAIDGRVQALVQGAPVLLPLPPLPSEGGVSVNAETSSQHHRVQLQVLPLPSDFLRAELKPRLRWRTASSRR